jgi:hypothetical protein
LGRYVDLGWHKDEKFGGAKQHASLTFEIVDITTADGHAMTVAQMVWNVTLKKGFNLPSDRGGAASPQAR